MNSALNFQYTTGPYSGRTEKKYHELEEEIRNLSAKLREAEKCKSDFLSNVRNEINNPLTSILGLTAQLMELNSNQQVLKLSKLVHQEVFELDYQMRNIIAASEVEAGQVKLLPSLVDIPALITAQINYLQPRTCTKNASIQFINDASGEVSFYTDPTLLQIIVMNLLANAVEFSQKNSNTIIRSRVENDSLFLQVEDFGEGIEPSMQKRIFERFHQLDHGSTKEHRGQGLGLAIVIEYVSMLEGAITCDSEEKVGTTITIRLPKLLSASANSTSFGNEILFNEGEEF